MVKESVTKALADAKIDYSEVQQAVASFVYGNTKKKTIRFIIVKNI